MAYSALFIALSLLAALEWGYIALYVYREVRRAALNKQAAARLDAAIARPEARHGA